MRPNQFSNFKFEQYGKNLYNLESRSLIDGCINKAVALKIMMMLMIIFTGMVGNRREHFQRHIDNKNNNANKEYKIPQTAF